MDKFGVEGFSTHKEAIENSMKHTNADNVMILHNLRKNDFAWVWPPDFARSLLSDTVIESIGENQA